MYPIKFKPILREHIWGGQRLLDIKRGQGVRADKTKVFGESWDVSGVDGYISVINNGFLKGNNLQEAIEVYMGDLVGESVFERFGLTFPLLLKTLNCEDRVSVQVHPTDELAAERHDSCGKTEMWYVVSAEPDAVLYIGFKDKNITREEYIDAVATGRVAELLQPVPVKQGDTFLIKSGTVHSMSGSIILMEIQQPVDLTYRIFDWDRTDTDGKPRQLHIAQAIDAIDFSVTADDCRCPYEPKKNEAIEIVKCDYFSVNILKVDTVAERDYSSLDSFVIYACVGGTAEVITDAGSETLKQGEVVLIPADTASVTIKGNADIIEYYLE